MAELQDRLAPHLIGRYTIERELGRGGMATVFEALDERHGRRVAIKVLDPDIGAAVGPERFQREIQIAARLSHPHILPVHDSGEADGLLYYVMPLVSGESLRGRMDREQQLPIDDALRITIEVADALSHAHSYGVVHRDIKPENILLQGGHAVVADFGIARAVSESGSGEKLTQTGASVGTPLYMSPEQAGGDPNLDGRSDIYSLGCVLYEMLVGQPPFTGPNAMAIIARHTMESVPSLQVVRQTIPDEVEDAIFSALEKVPADRFATAAQFREALEIGLAAAPISRTAGMRTPRMTRSGRTTRVTRVQRVRRRRWMAGGAAALVVAGAAIGALWWRGELGAKPSAMAGAFDPRRIAVLYLDHEPDDSTMGYLAAGLTESLIDRLSRVSALHVVSPNGVAPYRDAAIPRDSIARALQVGTLVSGQLESERQRTRLTLRLFDASGAEFRRGSFAIDTGDVASMERALSDSVETFLRARLGEEIRLRERASATASTDAWTRFQRASAARRSALEAGVEPEAALSMVADADSLLALAEEADPEWVDPIILRCQLALDVVALRARQRTGRGDWLERAHECAERAVTLAPNNADALEMRGTVRFRQVAAEAFPTKAERDRMLAASQADLERATALDPRQASAWAQLMLVHYRNYDVINAKLAAQRAHETDAFLARADVILYRLFATSYDLGQFDDARKWCTEGYRRFPTLSSFTFCRLLLLSVPGAQADPAVIWATADSLVSKYPAPQQDYASKRARIWAAAALGRGGLADSARRVLVAARVPPSQDPGLELAGEEAAVRAILGDREESLSLIRAYLTANPGHREGFARSLSWWWEDLRTDPRYQKLASG